jgi:phthiocerol/phenolphthiocerol synthesis type-I polyketide synthase E
MTTTTRSPWLLCRKRRPDAPMRLYCFPHSGGSAGEYLRWSDGLPDVEVWGLQLPGRGARLQEAPLITMTDLVSALVDQVDFSPPFAFFGHSLGALVAYETAQALRMCGRTQPQQLVLSAYAAPHLHQPGPAVQDLDGPSLLRAIEQAYGVLPPELHENPELQQLVVSGLRADLSILARYGHGHADPLDVPLTVLGGSDDEETPQRLAAWSTYTRAAFTLRVFPGDHFYFREQTHDVLGFLAGALGQPA